MRVLPNITTPNEPNTIVGTHAATTGCSRLRLPSFWQRDSTHGSYEVDVTSDKIVCRLKDMQPYEHIAPISVGFVSHALEAMGKRLTMTKLHGWSLTTPNPAEQWFELHWGR